MASRSSDFEIRRSLHSGQLQLHRHEPDTLVLDEFGLCQGAARIDIAVINGQLNGYEIKSERDTLERLPSQVEIYNRVLDLIVLVTSPGHAARIKRSLPGWWGLYLARRSADGDEIIFEVIRDPEKNDKVDPLAVAQLLWREEALLLLAEHGLHKGLASKPRGALWEILTRELPLSALQDSVRRILKARTAWRN